MTWVDDAHESVEAVFKGCITDDIRRLFTELEGKGVRLRNPGEVEEYLLRFPKLTDVARRAVRAAKRHLPEGELTLSVYRDPEIDDRYLLLCARLREYDRSALQRLKTAEAEFAKHLAHTTGWLQLTTDFAHPEHAL
jgi:hypothetical protein